MDDEAIEQLPEQGSAADQPTTAALLSPEPPSPSEPTQPPTADPQPPAAEPQPPATEPQPPAAEQPPAGNMMPNAVPSQAIPLFDAGNFEEVYAASLATPISVVENQFKQLLWNETPVQVNTPATEPELQTVLDVLQKIEPGLKEL